MLFSSIIFLFCFLPLVLFTYYVGCPVLARVGGQDRAKTEITIKNIVLFIASIIFYAYGEKRRVVLLAISIVGNYLIGMAISDSKDKAKAGLAKLFLLAGVLMNVGMLYIFKYVDFTITNVNKAFSLDIPLTHIALPIGISFFTFQALSYVIDVYRGKVLVQKNVLYLGLYISLFPQLVAGPIVRYEDVEHDIHFRKETIHGFATGIERFIIGLAKKVLLADSFVYFADKAFRAVEVSHISVLCGWFGIMAYALELYFDFSGYSDMAIGLGRMFGFNFNENFNYPYVARSLSDFWKRWHISLSLWFRDYVYIPLGGNRCSAFRRFFNVLAVWMLTGIWHGASWTYLFWAIAIYAGIMLEGLVGIGKKWQLPPVLGSIYVMFVFCIGLVFFRAEYMGQALRYLKAMFAIGASSFVDATTLFYIKDNWLILVLGVLFVTPVGKLIKKCGYLYDALVLCLFMICIIYIVRGGYSPFIYFNF